MVMEAAGRCRVAVAPISDAESQAAMAVMKARNVAQAEAYLQQMNGAKPDDVYPDPNGTDSRPELDGREVATPEQQVERNGPRGTVPEPETEAWQHEGQGVRDSMQGRVSAERDESMPGFGVGRQVSEGVPAGGFSGLDQRNGSGAAVSEDKDAVAVPGAEVGTGDRGPVPVSGPAGVPQGSPLGGSVGGGDPAGVPEGGSRAGNGREGLSGTGSAAVPQGPASGAVPSNGLQRPRRKESGTGSAARVLTRAELAALAERRGLSLDDLLADARSKGIDIMD